MIIKVCGMREPDNIRAVERLRVSERSSGMGFGVDWLGFIFWPKSSRYVTAPPAYLPTRCKRVGVFVDADTADVRQHVADYRLNLIQLHGHESPEYVKSLHGQAKIIKAISVESRDDIAAYKNYEGFVDYFLFDTKCKTVGGSGEHFDWTVLADYVGETPFLISGGIGPDDAERVKAFRHPRCVGIDLNSRFEIAPGLKDINKLKQFLEHLAHLETLE